MLATFNTVVSVLREGPTDEWLSISDISGVVDCEREIESDFEHEWIHDGPLVRDQTADSFAAKADRICG
jgi:hypothetical protein